MFSTEQLTEAVMYLSRKTSWTRTEILELTIEQLIEAINELRFQESLDEWDFNMNIAEILAAIYNTIPGRMKALHGKDFMNIPRPTRDGYGREEMEDGDSKARKMGIKIPKGE